MPLNVEIKARVADIEDLLAKASKLSESTGTILNQEDVFFNGNNGRLKLREIQGETSQLIFYDRPDQAGPKVSNFIITEVSHPDCLKAILSKALGVKGTVKKRRVLHLVGQTRVHIDQVEGLGNFVELEVILEDGQSVSYGNLIAADLMAKLGIKEKDLLTGAYMDMLNTA